MTKEIKLAVIICITFAYCATLVTHCEEQRVKRADALSLKLPIP